MRVMGELDREGLPRAVPAKELPVMLGSNPAFLSMGCPKFDRRRLNDSLAVLVFLPSYGREGKKPACVIDTSPSLAGTFCYYWSRRAQQKALDLAGGGFRQFGNEAKFVRAFEADQPGV